MTTATVGIDIVCPSWCTEPAAEHAAMLWELAGTCDHRTDVELVEDPVGFAEPLKEPRICEPIRLQLCALSSPTGLPQASPMVMIGDDEHTLEQAIDLADRLRKLVEMYRAECDTGGANHTLKVREWPS